MPTLTLELASTSPPNPLQRLTCLCACTPLQIRLQHFPPSPPSPLLLLPIFTLLQCPQYETTMPPSPLLTLPHPCLIFSLAYNSYAPAGPSSYASNATPTPLMPNHLSATYHPYPQVLDP
ncbi:hypothetical protein O181_092616 [Austropuccinia psidii MF-1]|uniref:Uncharacterized protein n=1 Tax=Austropuccinia psidii MF-1 TaxID=1389203 RepID=A0A9Q3IZV4_9BASI|nr:hypothetical protein [Austropuccinia psidii MF-1]